MFAASAPIAIGVVGAAPTLGVAIPADLSVVEFDDSPARALVVPRLTAIKTPLNKMAATAITLLGGTDGKP